NLIQLDTDHRLLQIIDVDTLMDSRMATRVILVLTLFTGLCGANLKGNIALHARAVQSSLGHPQGNAKHAVDGNRDSNYAKGSCTHTKTEFNPWVATVDSVFAGTKMFEFKPVKGRYVNIVLPGNDKVLTLCEVEVFAEADKPQYICVPRNLALGGKAVQSSTYSSLGAARNAIDGNRQSMYTLGSCSHTNGDRDPWWRVDLLGIYRVTRVSITNRGDCCEKRIEGIQIRIGNSLDNNCNNNPLAATVGPIPPGVTKTFAFRPIKGRYVNLIVPGRNEYLTLCEVEVYAD
ncbi:hypothetical protein cypCar_00040430, partial [Cyprinus carpio]